LGPSQQYSQFRNHLRHRSRLRASVAPTEAGAIVTADPREGSNFRLDQGPAQQAGGNAGFQHNSGTTGALLIKMEAAPPNIDDLTRGGEHIKGAKGTAARREIGKEIR
jgi:hypothetical protein